MWAKAVTADSLFSLFSLASEEAMGGPPASRLSFLSEFWLQMSHVCHILSVKREGKNKNKTTILTSLSKLCSAALRNNTLTPPTAPSRLLPLFLREQPR